MNDGLLRLKHAGVNGTRTLDFDGWHSLSDMNLSYTNVSWYDDIRSTL